MRVVNVSAVIELVWEWCGVLGACVISNSDGTAALLVSMLVA